MKRKPKMWPRGRPRDRTVDREVLDTALRLVKKHGVQAVTLELIAETTGIARTTIYRRWRNRSAILADAFLVRMKSEIAFPDDVSPLESIRRQMQLLAKSFRGEDGAVLRALLSEAMTDPEFQRAIHDGWIMPRRSAAIKVLERAKHAGELSRHISSDLLLDVLYGSLYYWLFFDPARLSPAYVNSLFKMAISPALS
jgi:AcrR family transcriptional regulator